MTEYDRVRELVTRQAADWLVAHRAGLPTTQHRRFAAWLKASPIHVEEYLALTVLSRDFRAACADTAAHVDELLRLETVATVTHLGPRHEMHTHRLRSALAAAAAVTALGVAMLAWHGYRTTPRPAPEAAIIASQHFIARHGEQTTHRLPDRSVLKLNTDSAATVTYDPTQRLVVLERGEAVFEVAADARRPFEVRAGGARIRALGTDFAVRLDATVTEITVLGGRVAVGGHDVPLGAGQQLRMAGSQVLSGPLTVDTQRATAWLRRQIVFEREPLERVAAEFNRYAPAPIEIVSPTLRSLEISGVFATDDTAPFLAFLRSLEGVRIEVTPGHILVSRDQRATL